MKKLRFVGEYTGKRESIEMGPYLFEGREATEVDETTDIGGRLTRNPDFECLDPLDHDDNGERGGSLPESPVSLTNKNKAHLLEIAEDEGAEIEADATNKEIVAAIEANRQ